MSNINHGGCCTNCTGMTCNEGPRCAAKMPIFSIIDMLDFAHYVRLNPSMEYQTLLTEFRQRGTGHSVDAFAELFKP